MPTLACINCKIINERKMCTYLGTHIHIVEILLRYIHNKRWKQETNENELTKNQQNSQQITQNINFSDI